MEITGPLTITFWAKTKFSDPLTQAAVNGVVTLIKETYNIDTNLFLDT